MAIQYRGTGTSGNGASSTTLAITLPTGWQAGDLLFTVIRIGSSAVTGFSQTGGTGTWTIDFTAGNGTANMTWVFAHRVMAGGDGAPTFSWTTSSSTCFSCGGFYSDSGGTLALDAYASGDPLVVTVPATTATPHAVTGAGGTEASIILTCCRGSATSTDTTHTYTPPSGWTWNDGDGAWLSGGLNPRFAANAYQLGVSGTVTPAHEDLTDSPTGNLFYWAVAHALVSETPAPAGAGGIGPAQPGSTWLRRFHHRQQPQLPAPAGGAVIDSTGSSPAGAGSVTAAATQIAPATAAGAGSVTAAATQIAAATAAGAGTVTAAATQTAPAAAAGAGAVTDVATQAATAAAAGAGSATALAVQAAIASAAGTGTATAAANSPGTATAAGQGATAALATQAATATAAGAGTVTASGSVPAAAGPPARQLDGPVRGRLLPPLPGSVSAAAGPYAAAGPPARQLDGPVRGQPARRRGGHAAGRTGTYTAPGAGTAAAAGAGSAAAAATQITAASAAGAGSAGPAPVTQIAPATAVGAATVTDVAAQIATATAAGAGTVTAVATQITVATATAAGAGTATATAVQTATPAGAGTVTAAVTQAATATAAGAGTVTAVATQAATGTAAAAGTVTAAGTVSISTGPNYATAAADLGGGAGTWTNPANAEVLDAAYATWAVP